MMPHIVIYNQLGVPPNFFKNLKGAMKQKRLKNTGLVVATLFLSRANFAKNISAWGS
jgi:hypothetical protein